MVIFDSQGTGLDIDNFNVLSLPGAKVEHVYNFVPRKDLYDIIVLFIGGNNLLATTTKNSVFSDIRSCKSFINQSQKGFRTWYTFTQVSTSPSKRS